MSGRPTAEIVADLRGKMTIWYQDIADMRGEAADRLAELDAEVESAREILGDFNRCLSEVAALGHSCAVWAEQNGRLVATLHAIDALRPPCPTCGGTQKGAEGMNVDGAKSWAHCPACIDGRVSIERMAAIVCTLFDELIAIGRDGTVESSDGDLIVYAADLLKFLRGVVGR